MPYLHESSVDDGSFSSAKLELARWGRKSFIEYETCGLLSMWCYDPSKQELMDHLSAEA